MPLKPQITGSACRRRRRFVFPSTSAALAAAAALLMLLAACPSPTASQTGFPRPPRLRWWKGNLHAHTFWSDGREYPEMAALWYKQRGYHFLAFTNHNRVQQGEKWINADTKPDAAARLAGYRRRFGNRWVEQRLYNGRRQVRLKTLSEFRALLEAPNRFLLIQGEEITDRFERLPVHLNTINLGEAIKPQGGRSVLEVLQNNVNAALAQEKRLRRPLLVQINHPNYGSALTAADIAPVRGARFFEVYNGHPLTANHGDARRPDTDRLWDEILARRLAQGNTEPMYGIAVDDAHHYHGPGARPGRGWVMVRAGRLQGNELITAMEAGDFYASTGVRLKNICRDGRRLSLEIEPEPGVTYTTRFIGTRKRGSRCGLEIGVTLAQVTGTSPGYTLRPGDWYVRAKVISSRRHPDPFAPGDVTLAWTQPMPLQKAPYGRRSRHRRQ